MGEWNKGQDDWAHGQRPLKAGLSVAIVKLLQAKQKFHCSAQFCSGFTHDAGDCYLSGLEPPMYLRGGPTLNQIDIPELEDVATSGKFHLGNYFSLSRIPFINQTVR